MVIIAFSASSSGFSDLSVLWGSVIYLNIYRLPFLSTTFQVFDFSKYYLFGRIYENLGIVLMSSNFIIGTNLIARLPFSIWNLSLYRLVWAIVTSPPNMYTLFGDSNNTGFLMGPFGISISISMNFVYSLVRSKYSKVVWYSPVSSYPNSTNRTSSKIKQEWLYLGLFKSGTSICSSFREFISSSSYSNLKESFSL